MDLPLNARKKFPEMGLLEFANMYPALKGPDGLCALVRFLCIPAASIEPVTIADLPEKRLLLKPLFHHWLYYLLLPVFSFPAVLMRPALWRAWPSARNYLTTVEISRHVQRFD
jgi:hypothetical protein